MPQAKTAAAAIRRSGAQIVASGAEGAVVLLDARHPSELREADEAALTQFKQRAAPMFRAICANSESYGTELRAELNALAGGEAPASVMALAQAAVNALSNCKLAQVLLGEATRDLESLTEKKAPVRRLELTQLQRTSMGLEIAFTDLVKRAREAAIEAGKTAEGTPTLGLMRRIGLQAPDPVPLSTGGVGAIGAPLSPNPPSPQNSTLPIRGVDELKGKP